MGELKKRNADGLKAAAKKKMYIVAISKFTLQSGYFIIKIEENKSCQDGEIVNNFFFF